MSASMTRDRAVYWLAVHALNQLHEHAATPRGCGPDCKPNIFDPDNPACCPDCCGPCGALEWLRDFDREWLDGLVRANHIDPEAQGWAWQDAVTRGVDWTFVDRCWNADTCWHNELEDGDEELPDEPAE